MHNTIAIAYIPVLHKGYFDFFDLCIGKNVRDLYLIGDDILQAHEELDYIHRKDRLRALPVSDIKKAIESTAPFNVRELTPDMIREISSAAQLIVTPKEDIGTYVVERYFPGIPTEYADIFLRWNRDNIGEDHVPNTEVIEASEFQRTVFNEVLNEASKSFDWWRQVGAALVQNGEVVYITHNEHMPEASQPNTDGDTRSLFKKGIHIEYGTAAHAEAAAIATAAKNGIKTEGAHMYVTDFPCPYCARLIAKAGIKKVYFLKGYAVLEGDAFLRGEGVELIHLQGA